MVHDLSIHDWPTSLDLLVTTLFFAAVLIVPGLGYAFMVADFRAYLRSLRRGIIQLGRYVWETPDWTRVQTPPPIAALGLRMPCTEEDLKRAYRKRVKQLHPDHGGDERRFMLLQAQFEEALTILGGQTFSDQR